ncbi:MAG: helix-turn-helix transcriptional regulator [Epsilonproteobacteria bacterium]|nr:helix-turn-helix transcriptional regulator [Campylobacterota bacterium]
MAIVMNNHVFKGHRTLLGSKFVTYGELELSTRTNLFQKSESFNWGSNGSGSLQLAFAMLYQITTDEELSSKYAAKYAQDVVKQLNSRDWVLSASEVIKWINGNCEIKPQEQQQTPNKVKKAPKKRQSNIVKDICKELNITQKQLAEILEIPEGTVSSWAVKNEIPRLGKKAIEFYIQNLKNQKIVDSYKNFIELLQAS